MKRLVLGIISTLVAIAAPAAAQTDTCTFAADGRSYFGARAGVAIPPDTVGVAPTFGAEIGLAPESGLGLGLHFIYSPNPPDVSWVGDASYGFGVEADVRWYLPRAGALQFYPFFSAGFMVGPDELTKENVLLPLVSPGLGTRLDLGPLYASFDFGLAAFVIPFVNFSVGGYGS